MVFHNWNNSALLSCQRLHLYWMRLTRKLDLCRLREGRCTHLLNLVQIGVSGNAWVKWGISRSLVAHHELSLPVQTLICQWVEAGTGTWALCSNSPSHTLAQAPLPPSSPFTLPLPLFVSVSCGKTTIPARFAFSERCGMRVMLPFL